jgi:hypothetical protein
VTGAGALAVAVPQALRGAGSLLAVARPVEVARQALSGAGSLVAVGRPVEVARQALRGAGSLVAVARRRALRGAEALGAVAVQQVSTGEGLAAPSGVSVFPYGPTLFLEVRRKVCTSSLVHFSDAIARFLKHSQGF